MRYSLSAVIAILGVAQAVASEKPEVRALDLKGVRVVVVEDFGYPVQLQIANAGQLKDSPLFEDAGSRDAIAGQVNFDREKLVVFAWTGSDGDRLSPKLEIRSGKLTVAFTYTAGKTEERRRHALVFAVPKEAAVEVEK